MVGILQGVQFMVTGLCKRRSRGSRILTLVGFLTGKNWGGRLLELRTTRGWVGNSVLATGIELMVAGISVDSTKGEEFWIKQNKNLKVVDKNHPTHLFVVVVVVAAFHQSTDSFKFGWRFQLGSEWFGRSKLQIPAASVKALLARKKIEKRTKPTRWRDLGRAEGCILRSWGKTDSFCIDVGATVAVEEGLEGD